MWSHSKGHAVTWGEMWWTRVHSPVLFIIISSSVNVCRGARGSPLVAALSWASGWEELRAWGGFFQEDRQLGKFLRSCVNHRHCIGNTHTRARAEEHKRRECQLLWELTLQPTLYNVFQQNKGDWPGTWSHPVTKNPCYLGRSCSKGIRLPT